MTHNHGLFMRSFGDGGVAQSVEQGSHKPRVVGSIPATATSFRAGRCNPHSCLPQPNGPGRGRSRVVTPPLQR